MKIFATSYLPSVFYVSHMLSEDVIAIEAVENYPKQTLRNRCFIYGANGIQCLTLPVQKKNTPSQYTKDMLIDYTMPWQRNHWRALVSSYNSSPYFLHYSSYFEPFYKKKVKFLVDFNNEMLDVVLNRILKKDIRIELTSEYHLIYENNKDLRYLCNVKNNNQQCRVDKLGLYYQVFADKFDFKPNLSIIDLIFNEGKAANAYLKMVE